jgi:hypothetical protein
VQWLLAYLSRPDLNISRDNSGVIFVLATVSRLQQHSVCSASNVVASCCFDVRPGNPDLNSDS